MSQTFGDIRMRLAKLPHGAGVDPDLLDGYINDRYQEILDHHPWTRLDVDTILQTAAKYDTGTVAITLGATALVGTSTVFTAAMTGRRIRIGNQPEYYTFTYVSATSGTIDRAWEHADVTAAAYRIWQAIYTLPADLDYIKSLRIPASSIDIDQVSQELLDFRSPNRDDYGEPQCFAPFDDTAAGLAQLELFPGPDISEGLPFRYRKMIARFGPADTGVQFLSWVSETALFNAVEADLYLLAGNTSEASGREGKYQALLASMVRQDNQRIAPQQIRMANRFIQHRVDRAYGGGVGIQDKIRRMP